MGTSRQEAARLRAQRINVNGELIAPVPDDQHGRYTTYTYYACRCTRCRAEGRRRYQARRDLILDRDHQRARQRKNQRVYRLGRWTHPDAPHGTLTGYNCYYCRCLECSQAIADYHHDRSRSGHAR